jgi:hypothetical protein
MSISIQALKPSDPKRCFYETSNAVWFAISRLVDTITELEPVWKMDEVSAQGAEEIARCLDSVIALGAAAEFERSYRAAVEVQRPRERCRLCDGTGKGRPPMVLPGSGECLSCRGTGLSPRPGLQHVFSVKDVSEFAAFCRSSGGFSRGGA